MRRSEKLRYSLDPASKALRMRSIAESEYSIDKNNSLTCRLRKPVPSDLPSQLKLTGKWSLDKEHNLKLSLDRETGLVTGDKLTLQSEIIDAKANELTFTVRTRDSKGQSHLSLLRLSGIWQADLYNRLTFLVERGTDRYDTLTFSAGWEVNKNNQLVYTYTKTGLKRKVKLTRTLTLKGSWDITQKNRVTYVLNKELGSGFDFKVGLGRPAKRGLMYEVGIGAAHPKKKFLIFGSWKVNDRLGLVFELPYEKGKLDSIVFGADCRIAEGTTLEFRLRNELHRDLGLSLRLSKSILGDSGNAFLEALKEKGNIAILAGVGIRW